MDSPPKKLKRAPVEVDHKRTPRDGDFRWAVELVDDLGTDFHEALKLAIGEGRGRPSSVTARAVLIAWALLMTEHNHKAEITDAAAQLVALHDGQLAALGMERIPVNRAYKRFHDKFTAVRRALAQGFTFHDGEDDVHVTLDWWTANVPQRAIPADLPHSSTRAVDGTDWETAGRFRTDATAEYDGDAPVDADHDPADHLAGVAKTRRRVKRANKWEIGPDGRAIHTTDRDARAGYRTGTAGRNGGMYIGSELHLVAQVADFTWSGDVTRVNEGPEVPGFITGAVMAAAGSHRSKTVMPLLTDPRQGVKTVVWDRGYSIQEFKSAHGPLIAAGIDAIFDLSKTQREHPPVSEQVLWIDGQPFHLHTPEHLRELERPPMNSTAEVRREYEEKFNERAAWRWSRLARPDRDGVTRWICPFHAGRLKCRSFRQTKVKASAPLVTLPAGVTKCCDGTLQVTAEYLNLVQGLAIPYGTTAHSKAYGRRNLVETGNSYFGGTYIDLSRTYSRLMGNTTASSSWACSSRG